MLDLTNDLAAKREAIQESILTWSNYNLQDYPWRRNKKNPYAVLVAELLLKRTTATAAAKIYPIFLKKYKKLLHLAKATEEELMKDLAGWAIQTTG